MKRNQMKKGAPAGALAIALLSISACYTPPAVVPVNDPDWQLETSRYPVRTEAVEVEVEDGEFMRGILVPADPGAPLILQFLEASASVTWGMRFRSEYGEFADLGYASLVLDYRGVGASDGEASPDQLRADAHAAWRKALELVDGDSSRIVLRAVSLGGLAIASLLEDGVEPAAVVLYAPVRGENVAVHFAYATMGDFWVTMARPFLRDVGDADLVAALAGCSVPLLVFSRPEDELLDDEDWRMLTAAVETANGQIEQPTSLRWRHLRIPSDDSELGRINKALDSHVKLAGSSSYQAFEQDWLAELFPGLPPVELRRAAALEAGEPVLVAKVEADEDAWVRLGEMVARYPGMRPDVLLAAALGITDPAAAEPLFADELKEGRRAARRSVYAGRSVSELQLMLDHRDPDGELPANAIGKIREVLVFQTDRYDLGEFEEWRLRDACALADALLEQSRRRDELAAKLEAWSAPWEEGSIGVRVMPTVRVEGFGRHLTYDGETVMSVWGDESLSEGARRRRVQRVCLKAAGFPDRIVDDGDDGWRVEVLQHGSWATLDC